ncbi:S8 family serine peptidase [Actinoplanes sp. NPDC020271]|uniref:S8 family serine peptidase n=1 Tax=Actinoplanes sp. NPDC020271 TaxID=3363896 RepID=UPI0037A14B54
MRIVATCLSSLLLAGLVATPARADEAPPVILDIGVRQISDRSDVVARFAARTLSRRVVVGLNAVTMTVAAADRESFVADLLADPAVTWVEEDAPVHADSAGPVNDPFYSPSLDAAAVPEAWTWTTGSADVTVAVVDSGVTANRDLPAARILRGLNLVESGREPVDDDGHGTLVAGVIAATANNGVSAAGVCPQCRILPVRVLKHDADGGASGTSALAASGITYAAANGARVINTSFSTTTDSRLLREAVQYAADRGALVIGSAGQDDYRSDRHYPAATEPALAVAAAMPDGLPAAGTNMNPLNSPADRWIDVEAPASLWAVAPSGTGGPLFGTSASAAAVSGAAALAFSLKPTASADEVRSAIVKTAGDPDLTGFGLVGEISPYLDVAGLLHSLGAPDTEAPRITSSTLTLGVLGATGTTVLPQAVDDHGVYGFELVADGKVVASTRDASWDRQMRLVPPEHYRGDWPVTLRAIDYAGNVTEKTYAVPVDTGGPLDADGPVATGLLPAANTRIRGTFTSTISGVTDSSGVASAELWSNGKLVGRDTSAPYALTVRTGTASGYVNLIWKLTDTLGNTSDHTRRVIADNAGPTVSITKAPGNKAKVKGTVKISVKASDAAGVARVQVLVNGKVVATDTRSAYLLSVNTAKQAKTMKIQIRAYDRLGNLRYTSARTWYRK